MILWSLGFVQQVRVVSSVEDGNWEVFPGSCYVKWSKLCWALNKEPAEKEGKKAVFSSWEGGVMIQSL
jgi:hypothetical protein